MNNSPKKPKLNLKTAREIEAARKRIQRGEYYSEKDAKKTLGL